MVQVKLIANLERTTVVVPETETPKQTLDNNDVDYSQAQVFLNGSVLNPRAMDTSYADQGIKDTAMLSAVVKQDNG